jgi:hypothetical protein
MEADRCVCLLAKEGVEQRKSYDPPNAAIAGKAILLEKKSMGACIALFGIVFEERRETFSRQ